jgi:hypothetical protein
MRLLTRKLSSHAILTPATPSHTIVVEQIPGEDAFDNDRPKYKAKITIDNDVKYECTFYDPLLPEEYESCSSYLNSILDHGNYNAGTAQQVSELINRYGFDLFKQLLLVPHSQNLKHAKVDIDIREAPRTHGSRNTIHRLRWEQLEDGCIWSTDNGCHVTVRRSVPQKDNTIEKHKAVRRCMGNREKALGQINILLIIARNLQETKPGKYYEVDPGITLRAILQIKHKLEMNRDARHQIHLEIVRPGTFAALKKHLKLKGKGYFDIIHFDLHGWVDRSNKYALAPRVLPWPPHALHTDESFIEQIRVPSFPSILS